MPAAQRLDAEEVDGTGWEEVARASGEFEERDSGV